MKLMAINCKSSETKRRDSLILSSHLLQMFLENVQFPGVAKAENNLLKFDGFFQELPNSAHGDAGADLQRNPIESRSHGRKGDSPQFILFRLPECVQHGFPQFF